MFESAEIGHSIDKEAYDAEVPALREALLEAQYELKQQARFPVIVLINGIEGAGKGETVASVAKRYRLSPATVAEWNQVSVTANFKPGQAVVLYLPAGNKPATEWI